MNYPINMEDFFLVAIYVCLNVRPLTIICTFYTKICDSINNYVHHGQKHVEYSYIFVKPIWFLCASSDWTYRHGRKTQHFNYYKLWYLFLYFEILHSNYVILLGLCLILAEILFLSTLLGVCRMNYPVKVNGHYLQVFSGYVHAL